MLSENSNWEPHFKVWNVILSSSSNSEGLKFKPSSWEQFQRLSWLPRSQHRGRDPGGSLSSCLPCSTSTSADISLACIKISQIKDIIILFTLTPSPPFYSLSTKFLASVFPHPGSQHGMTWSQAWSPGVEDVRVNNLICCLGNTWSWQLKVTNETLVFAY